MSLTTETLTNSSSDDSEPEEAVNTKTGGGIALLHQKEQFTSPTSNHDLLLSWLGDDGVNLTNVSASRPPETRLQHHWLPDELWPDQSLAAPYNNIDKLDAEDATPVLLKVLGLQWSVGATHAGRQSLRNELLTRLQVGLVCVTDFILMMTLLLRVVEM